MLKNKFLVIAAFCFIGFSFAGDESQEESLSLTDRAKTCLKSAVNSPVTVFVFTGIAASLIEKSSACIPFALVPGLTTLSKNVEKIIRNEKTSSLYCINFAVPSLVKVNKLTSIFLAYYTSLRVFQNSDINQSVRLISLVPSLAGSLSC